MPKADSSNSIRPLMTAADFSDQFDDIANTLHAFSTMLGAAMNDGLSGPRLSGGVEMLFGLIGDHLRDVHDLALDALRTGEHATPMRAETEAEFATRQLVENLDKAATFLRDPQAPSVIPPVYYTLQDAIRRAVTVSGVNHGLVARAEQEAIRIGPQGVREAERAALDALSRQAEKLDAEIVEPGAARKPHDMRDNLILTLTREGKTPSEISQALSMKRGAVEKIIGQLLGDTLATVKEDATGDLQAV